MDAQADLADTAPLERLLGTLERLPRVIEEVIADAAADGERRMARFAAVLEAARDDVRAAERALENADDDDARHCEDRLEDLRARLRRLEDADEDARVALGHYNSARRELSDVQKVELAGGRRFIVERLEAVRAYEAFRIDGSSTTEPTDTSSRGGDAANVSDGLAFAIPRLESDAPDDVIRFYLTTTQAIVDAAYPIAEAIYNGQQNHSKVPKNTVVGQIMDGIVRFEIRKIANELQHGEDIIKINKRMYDGKGIYTIPDYVYYGSYINDLSLEKKTHRKRQISRFYLNSCITNVSITTPRRVGIEGQPLWGSYSIVWPVRAPSSGKRG